jgi:hypothetical protein
VIYALCMFFGFVLAVAINRARWAIFPLSGGPTWSSTGTPVFGFFGQAPERPRHRFDACETCHHCRGCDSRGNHEPVGIE